MHCMSHWALNLKQVDVVVFQIISDFFSMWFIWCVLYPPFASPYFLLGQMRLGSHS